METRAKYEFLHLKNVSKVNKDFKQWLLANNYSSSTIANTLPSVKKYGYILKTNSYNDLDNFKPHTKTNIIKALIRLSKVLGCYKTMKTQLKQHGIKLYNGNSYDSFLRILNSNNNQNDVIDYYKQAKAVVRDNEQLFPKFLLYSGLRVSEAINSFNKVIDLAKKNKLEDYYNPKLRALIHMQYKQFNRKTKKATLTFIKPKFLSEITNSTPIGYHRLRKRLEKYKLPLKLKYFRRYQNTLLLNNGLSEIEVNLISGRVNGILLKHYFTPQLDKLAAKVFKALETVENL